MMTYKKTKTTLALTALAITGFAFNVAADAAKPLSRATYP